MPNFQDPHPEFTAALIESANRCIKEVKYRPHDFFEMIKEHPGCEVAKSLILSPKPSKGFENLAAPERSRLDLTMEAIVIQPKWWPIFEREILQAAHERLRKYGYKFPVGHWLPEFPVTPRPDGNPTTTSLTLPPPPTPLAADTSAPPPRIEATTYRILRDTEIARRVKVLHGYKCQICGDTIKLADGSLYAEAHHIQPLGAPHNGPDIMANLLCLCPNHHVMMDYFTMPLELAKLPGIPGHSVGEEFVRYHNARAIPTGIR